MWFAAQGICPWSILDAQHKTWLGTSLIFSGLMGSATNGWLIGVFCLRLGATTHAHMLLLNTCLASLCRGLLSGFPFTATSALAGRWLFGATSCQMFAFLHHFFGLAEFLSISLQSAERVCSVKNYEIGNKVFVTSVATVWISALIWSALPIFGIGRFGCNLTGVSCGMDWRPLRGTQFWFNVSYLSGCIAFTVIVIILMLIYTSFASRAETGSTKQREEKATANAVMNMTVGMFLLWLPESVLTIMIMFRFEPDITSVIVIMAPISSEVASMIPTVAFLSHDLKLRKAMLGTGREEDEDHPSRAKNRRHVKRWHPCCCH